MSEGDSIAMGPGKPANLHQLVKTFYAAVRRRACRILGDSEDASDVAQEVFLRAMRLPENALRTNPRAWLYRVTTNLCLNRLRDSNRRGKLLSGVHPDGVFECASGSRAILWALIRDVPDDLLSPAISYYVEDLSHAEIASRLGVSRRTVGNRITAFHAFLSRLDARGDRPVEATQVSTAWPEERKSAGRAVCTRVRMSD